MTNLPELVPMMIHALGNNNDGGGERSFEVCFLVSGH